MVALPQLNCGRAPFTMAYTISSILHVDLLVYAVVITVYYYFLFEI